MEPTCTCGRIGMEITDLRNWNEGCVVHGLESAWWSSPEEVTHREAQVSRLRDLYAQARQARAEAVATELATAAGTQDEMINE